MSHDSDTMSRSNHSREEAILIKAMNASLAVGAALLAIKLWAAARTGSSAIYSDAAKYARDAFRKSIRKAVSGSKNFKFK